MKDGTELENSLFNETLAEVDKTYAQIPHDLFLEIDKVNEILGSYGPRLLPRKGPGLNHWDFRDYDPQIHERRQINWKVSAKRQREIASERQAETMQRFYLARDSGPTMQWKSKPDLPTKKHAAEIVMLSFAMFIAGNAEGIGILNEGGSIFRGSAAAGQVLDRMTDAVIVPGTWMDLDVPLPRKSSVLLFSDFLMDPGILNRKLDDFSAKGVSGALVMVLDPEECDYISYSGPVRFNGCAQEGRIQFENAQDPKKAYLEALHDHVSAVMSIADSHGFSFVLQRTDKGLHDGLIPMIENGNMQRSKQGLKLG